MAKRKLTPRQKRFIAEYVQCLNASEAARRAGYAEKGVGQTAHNLLKNPEISEEINTIFEEQAMTPQEVAARLASQARGDIGDFYDESTNTIDWKRARNEGKTHLIKKIKQTTITGEDKDTHIFEFELHDSQKALVHIGKIHAMFRDRTEVTGKDGANLLEGLIINIGDDSDD